MPNNWTARSVMNDLEGYITAEQVDKILLTCERSFDRMLILLGFRTGRRIGEYIQLQAKDIDFDKGLITFNILKKRAPLRKLKPVDGDTLAKLKEYTKGMQPDRYIFASPYKANYPLSTRQAYNIVRKSAEKAGIFTVGLKPMHTHVLRHSFATHFIRKSRNKTVTLLLLQKLMEHSDIKETAVYLQFSQEDERKELDNIFGGGTNG